MAETQLIRCPSCGATNRVPQDKVESGLQPVCRRCTPPLTGDRHRQILSHPSGVNPSGPDR